MRGRAFTDDECLQILRMRDEGKSIREIGAAFGRSFGTIGNLIRDIRREDEKHEACAPTAEHSNG